MVIGLLVVAILATLVVGAVVVATRGTGGDDPAAMAEPGDEGAEADAGNRQRDELCYLQKAVFAAHVMEAEDQPVEDDQQVNRGDSDRQDPEEPPVKTQFAQNPPHL